MLPLYACKIIRKPRNFESSVAEEWTKRIRTVVAKGVSGFLFFFYAELGNARVRYPNHTSSADKFIKMRAGMEGELRSLFAVRNYSRGSPPRFRALILNLI